MVSVAGMYIFLALSHTLFAISVSFLAFCFSFRKTKYSLSRYGFMSNFNLACLIILVYDRNLSFFIFIRKHPISLPDSVPVFSGYPVFGFSRMSSFSPMPKHIPDSVVHFVECFTGYS